MLLVHRVAHTMLQCCMVAGIHPPDYSLLTVHVPPFMQGLGSHSSVSLSQLAPSNPAAHRHSY